MTSDDGLFDLLDIGIVFDLVTGTATVCGAWDILGGGCNPLIGGVPIPNVVVEVSGAFANAAGGPIVPLPASIFLLVPALTLVVRRRM